MTVLLSKYDPSKSYLGQKTFDCGLPVIDSFVRNSLKAQVKGNLSVAHVLTDSSANDLFVGFFTIAQHQIDAARLSAVASKSLPRYVPCVRLIMLGVSKAYQNGGLGLGMMQEALAITKDLSSQVGTFGMYLDAQADPRATALYRKLGFVFLEGDKTPHPSPMFIPTASIA